MAGIKRLRKVSGLNCLRKLIELKTGSPTIVATIRKTIPSIEKT